MNRLLAAGLVLALSATPAFAHPKLLASSPAEGSAGGTPKQIKLDFSEKLFSNLSGAKLIGANGQPAGKADVSFGPDGKSMIVVPAKPLAAGSYSVEWYGVAGDTHRVTGTLHFTVR